MAAVASLRRYLFSPRFLRHSAAARHCSASARATPPTVTFLQAAAMSRLYGGAFDAAFTPRRRRLSTQLMRHDCFTPPPGRYFDITAEGPKIEFRRVSRRSEITYQIE